MTKQRIKQRSVANRVAQNYWSEKLQEYLISHTRSFLFKLFTLASQTTRKCFRLHRELFRLICKYFLFFKAVGFDINMANVKSSVMGWGRANSFISFNWSAYLLLFKDCKEFFYFIMEVFCWVGFCLSIQCYLTKALLKFLIDTSISTIN